MALNSLIFFSNFLDDVIETSEIFELKYFWGTFFFPNTTEYHCQFCYFFFSPRSTYSYSPADFLGKLCLTIEIWMLHMLPFQVIITSRCLPWRGPGNMYACTWIYFSILCWFRLFSTEGITIQPHIFQCNLSFPHWKESQYTLAVDFILVHREKNLRIANPYSLKIKFPNERMIVFASDTFFAVSW